MQSFSRGAAWMLVAVATIGCAGDDDGVGDGGGLGDAALGPDGGIAPPAAPALPVLTPCPTGWAEGTASTGVTTCDPYPESGAPDCAPHEAPFPGDDGCSVVGSACPSGEFPDDLPVDGPVFFVLSGSTAGDGSRTSPYGTVRAGAAAARSGATVAVGRGTYDEDVGLRGGVTLRGACAAETILTNSTRADGAGVLNVAGAGAVIRDIQVAGAQRSGIWVVGAGRSAHLEGVIVDDVDWLGLVVTESAELTANELVVRATRGNWVDGSAGRGLLAQDGSTIELRRAVFEGNRDVAVFASTGVSLLIEDSLLRDTDSQLTDLQRGRGVNVETGATGEVRRVVSEGNRNDGYYVGTDSTLLLEDVIGRDSLGILFDGAFGRGLDAEGGGQATIRRGLFERNTEMGIWAGDSGSALTLEDVVIRDTTSRDDDVAGRGLNLEDGARATVTRALLERNEGSGVVAAANTRLAAEDLWVRDTESRLDGTGGRAFEANREAQAVVTRALFERNRDICAFVTHAATATLEDLVVRDCQGQALDFDHGYGVGVQLEGSLTLRRAFIERAEELGVFASDVGTVATLEDLVVRDTQPNQADLEAGRGVNAQLGAEVDVVRALILGSREIGAFSSRGSNLRMQHIEIGDSLERACAPACAGRGIGAGAYVGGTLQITDFLIHDSALCGVHIADGGELDLLRGVISDNPIGACVQQEGYDVDRLSDGVDYRDNGTTLDTTTLPVPDVSDALDP